MQKGTVVSMLNNVSLMGRLVRDAELKMTQNGISTATFTIACERDFKNPDGKKETDFITIVAWRHTAEYVCQYAKKGDMLAVSGRLQMRSYEDRSGQKRTVAEVVANNAYAVGNRNNSDTQQQTTAPILPDDVLFDGTPWDDEDGAGMPF